MMHLLIFINRDGGLLRGRTVILPLNCKREFISRVASELIPKKTSVEAIKKINGLDNDLVKVGQILLIPKKPFR
jgi:LysM domain